MLCKSGSIATSLNRRLVDCYQRLIAAGKRPKVALVACMRKPLVFCLDLPGRAWA